MRVISLKPLRDFWERHPPAENPLRAWYRIATKAHWGNLNELRQVYPSADLVKGDDSAKGKLVIFNIKGNDYRLVARIVFEWEFVLVKKVMTHAEYSKHRWKEEM